MRPTSGLFPAFVALSLALHGVLGAAWVNRPARVVDPKPAFAGETFDIGSVLEDPPAVLPVEDPLPSTPVATSVAHHRTSPATGGQASRAVEAPLTYGALGDRTAAGVGVTLSRGFPQAASTDPVWATVPFGEAGSAVMEVELAEDGTVSRWNLGPGASPALRQGIVRTMALVGSRLFIARKSITRLRVEARVTADAVRDGSDAVYAIHSEHEGDRASAYFSLSSGRRVDLVLTTLP